MDAKSELCFAEQAEPRLAGALMFRPKMKGKERGRKAGMKTRGKEPKEAEKAGLKAGGIESENSANARAPGK